MSDSVTYIPKSLYRLIIAVVLFLILWSVAKLVIEFCFPQWRGVDGWILLAATGIGGVYFTFGILGPLRNAARRRAAGLCIHCGYDLRATPERCPECGRVPESASPIQ